MASNEVDKLNCSLAAGYSMEWQSKWNPLIFFGVELYRSEVLSMADNPHCKYQKYHLMIDKRL